MFRFGYTQHALDKYFSLIYDANRHLSSQRRGIVWKMTWGFKKVIIPAKNYKHSFDPRDYYIEVLPAENLDDYLKECLV